MLLHEIHCDLPANNQILPTLPSLVFLTSTPDHLLSFPFPSLATATTLGTLHAFSVPCATSQRFADVFVAKPAQIQTEENQGMQKELPLPARPLCLLVWWTSSRSDSVWSSVPRPQPIQQDIQVGCKREKQAFLITS